MSALEVDAAGLSVAGAGGGRARSWRLWVISFLLFLPFYFPFVTHFLYPPAGLQPTGFIQPDMPYYVGNAREHFDDGGFHLLYGLPYSPFYDTPRIYFQPQTLAMGIVMKVTGMDPALLYLLFGAIFSVICCRLALAIFEHLFGLRTAAQWLTAISFIWGGGVLVAVGALRWAQNGFADPNDLFMYDPFDGMWFLNFGRNFIYPHEAYYHAVWLGATLCLIKRRYWAVLGLVVLEAASHPFTGVQLVCSVLGWAALDRFWIGNRDVPIRFILALGVTLAAHLGYYQWVLPHSIEHQQVELQWILSSQDWTYEAKHFIPAYALAALLVAWLIRTPALAGTVFSKPFPRFLAMWAAVSFALANNEFAFRPNIQPLHFTRGYVWMALFILGAPALIAGLQWLLDRRSRILGIAGVAACITVLFTDNVVFLSTFHWRTHLLYNEMWIAPGFRDLAKFLSEPEQAGGLVLTPDQQGVPFNHFPYLLTTYTPLRTWHSHPFNTPLMRQRYLEIMDLFANGNFLPVWSKMKLLVVISPRMDLPEWMTTRGARKVYENQTYAVYRIDPAPSIPFGGVR